MFCARDVRRSHKCLPCSFGATALALLMGVAIELAKDPGAAGASEAWRAAANPRSSSKADQVSSRDGLQ